MSSIEAVRRSYPCTVMLMGGDPNTQSRFVTGQSKFSANAVKRRFLGTSKKDSWDDKKAAPSQRRLRMILPSSPPTSARGTIRYWLARRWARSRPVGNDASLLPYGFFSIETYGSPAP